MLRHREREMCARVSERGLRNRVAGRGTRVFKSEERGSRTLYWASIEAKQFRSNHRFLPVGIETFPALIGRIRRRLGII